MQTRIIIVPKKLVQEGSGLKESNNIGSPAAKFNLMTAPNISAENQSTQMEAQIATVKC